MRKAALALWALPWLAGCLAYPRLHLAQKKGRAYIEDGKPIRIQANIVRECESTRGESTKEGPRRETTTDAQGRYAIRVVGFAFNSRNFITAGRCTSRVQLYACRLPGICKPVDEVDLEVLGK